MSIDIKTYQEILGNMVRKIKADTNVNDINEGSVLLTLLEAAAQNDFDNNTAMLSILDLLNINAVRNNDLDSRGADFGLTRYTATQASGFVTVTDTNFTKHSTGFYQVKRPPITGDTKIYVNDASLFQSSGQIYIGRGTTQFEGPIPYSSITNNGTFFTINLSAALQKDHLSSETIVDAQGTIDRLIPSNTKVIIPANNQNPTIEYITLRSSVVPAGETESDQIPIVAVKAGSMSNAGIGTIAQFSTPPFTGAAVSNADALINGRDTETDEQFRERIKSYTSTLARGTKTAILSSIVGLSDQTDNKQIVSAFIRESTSVGDPSILYIDDGAGFQPSFEGQNIDVLIDSAEGHESFLQLTNYPLPRPQVTNTGIAPYELVDGMTLRVAVDGVEESIVFSAQYFTNIAAVSIADVITYINSPESYGSKYFKARFTNNSQNIILSPISATAETIQVMPMLSTEDPSLYANSIFKFPTNLNSYIKLYQNNTLLKERSVQATLYSVPAFVVNITGSGNLIISVDGTPPQDHTFTVTDFGATSFTSLSLNDWVTAFNKIYAGITASANINDQLVITSNKTGSQSTLKIVGGTYVDTMFGDLPLEISGRNSDFKLNRQTGNIQLLTTISKGDSITAGSTDTRGSEYSSATNSGTYNISNDAFGRPPEMIVTADDSDTMLRSNIVLAVGSQLTIQNPATNIMRILSSVQSTFEYAFPGDYIYITKRTSPFQVNITTTNYWTHDANTGLFKIISKGPHTTANTDTWIDVVNINVDTSNTVSNPNPFTILDKDDLKIFKTTVYPQLWKGLSVPTPSSATIDNVTQSFKDQLINIDSTIYKTSKVKISSTDETDGSIALPVVNGQASTLFTTSDSLSGNTSHIANKVNNKDFVTFFKHTPIVDTFFDRVTYTDYSKTLITGIIPGISGIDPFSEVLDATGLSTDTDYNDVIGFVNGSNKNLYRYVREISPSTNLVGVDKVGTQFNLPTTIMNSNIGDAFSIYKPFQIHCDDEIFFILDRDPTFKTIGLPLSRKARVNTQFVPNTNAFSADDIENEAGITFGTLNVWSKTITNTEFKDYATWFRAHNWYQSISGGSFLIRAKEFGPHGENIRFGIDYPSIPNQSEIVRFTNTPAYTQAQYLFGSGAEKSTNIVAGTQFGVSSLGSNMFRYTFVSPGVSLTSVTAGDILSILDFSGVSVANRGQLQVRAVNAGNKTIDVYNVNGAATNAGTKQETQISGFNAENPGSVTQYNIVITANPNYNNTMTPTWFYIKDDGLLFAVIYDFDGSYVPGTAGADGEILISSTNFLTPVDEIGLATMTAGAVNLVVTNFSAFSVNDTVSIATYHNGYWGDAYDGSGANATGFFPTSTTPIHGVAYSGLGGTYFDIPDVNGLVRFWYFIHNTDSSPGLGSAYRLVQINTVLDTDTASVVASKTNTVISLDGAWTTSINTNIITVTDALAGVRSASSAGTSGLTISSTVTGVDAVYETIINSGYTFIFSLNGTGVSSIVSAINLSPILTAAAVNTAQDIIRATKDETSPSANYVAYNYVADDTYISLYDSVNWVKDFQNTNPNFIFKKPFILQNVNPSMYSMSSAVNANSSDLGEEFRLIPVTLHNMYHQLSHKALSQLPIVSNVDVAGNMRKIQIKSKILGSAGSIEVIGGNGNSISASIYNEGQIVSQTINSITKNYLSVKIPVNPIFMTQGDIVKIQNTKPAKRLSRLVPTDTLSVVAVGNNAQYQLNAKNASFSNTGGTFSTTVNFTITSLGNNIWRWTHDEGSYDPLNTVNVGDLLIPHGVFNSNWAQGNLNLETGSSTIGGFPIVNVYSNPLGGGYIDVINPNGSAMASQPIGPSGLVDIYPTYFMQFKLKHYAPVEISTIVINTNIATCTTVISHNFSVGDTFTISGAGDNYSNPIPSGTYTVASVINSGQFTFAITHTNNTYYSGLLFNTAKTPTQYKIESMGFNNLYKITCTAGDSPEFLKCGTAVGDIVRINGSTFASQNQGLFKILGVTDNSIIIENANATEELNTIKNFNNINTPITWQVNNGIILGTAGAFANLVIGDWVKKIEDTNEMYVQVVDFLDAGNASTTAAAAVKLLLGHNYEGTASLSVGVALNQITGINGGVYLSAISDISIYEGDSALVGDSLFIDNLIRSSWFAQSNTGNFVINETGLTSAHKPYIQVSNSAVQNQSTVLIGTNKESFMVLEKDTNLYSMTAVVENHAVDDFDTTTKRAVYLTPAVRAYKVSQDYGSKITHIGKLGYSTELVNGIDGYEYYTGLLRTAQRTIDGFEPDPINYPGRRAIGGAIEILPPVIERIAISVQITTNVGVNISDITNDVKSAIIRYINNLGVGEDVILSEVIVKVMSIIGVQSALIVGIWADKFLIPISQDSKAFTTLDDINVS